MKVRQNILYLHLKVKVWVDNLAKVKWKLNAEKIKPLEELYYKLPNELVKARYYAKLKHIICIVRTWIIMLACGFILNSLILILFKGISRECCKF